MPSTPADLAEFRLLRALRAGQPGAFPSVWNAQAGPCWSVFRALTESDGEALGWMASFRLDLSERAVQFNAGEALAPQMGRALVEHVGDVFDDDEPLPTEPLTPDEAGLRCLPLGTRMLYLVDLFFDWSPPDPRVRAAYRLLEPAQDTDARLLVHAALMKSPPAAALILPPGAEDEAPPVSPARRGVFLIAAVGALALAVLPLALALVGTPIARDAAHLHAEALGAGEGIVLEGDTVRLQVRLARLHVSALLTECPDLSSLGLSLLGARVIDDAVVLIYRSGNDEWTLQHLDGDVLPRGTELSRAGDLIARRAGEGAAVGWRGSGTTWVLVSNVDASRVLTIASGIIALRSHPVTPASTPFDPIGPGWL